MEVITDMDTDMDMVMATVVWQPAMKGILKEVVQSGKNGGLYANSDRKTAEVLYKLTRFWKI